MYLSKLFIPLLKETPSEAKIKSHQLMLRSGMIKQSSAGIYLDGIEVGMFGELKQEIADHCQRVIRLVDGKVVSDVRKGEGDKQHV